MTPLSADDVPEATELLAAAFAEDPLFLWLFPDAEELHRGVAAVMRANLRVAIPRGAAFGIRDGELRAACIWFDPGGYPTPFLPTLAARAEAVARAVRRGGVRPATVLRALRISELMEESHPTVPFGYLQVLGVHPRAQGRGLGSSLLRKMTERVDRAGAPAQLETAKELNVKLYRRFGFEIIETIVTDSSPPLWTMRREPAKAAG